MSDTKPKVSESVDENNDSEIHQQISEVTELLSTVKTQDASCEVLVAESPIPAKKRASNAPGCVDVEQTTVSSVHDDPNFAVICSFLTRYGSILGLPEVSFEELEKWVDATRYLNNSLKELMLRLLKRWKTSANEEKFVQYLIKFCYTYSQVDAWEIEEYGFQRCKTATKLRIFKNLLEQQFDSNTKFKDKINEIPATDLRWLPIGRDVLGRVYWYLIDKDMTVRIYREEQDDVENESWQIVVSDRNQLAGLIASLEEQRLKGDPKSRSASPSTVCSEDLAPPSCSALTTTTTQQHERPSESNNAEVKKEICKEDEDIQLLVKSCTKETSSSSYGSLKDIKVPVDDKEAVKFDHLSIKKECSDDVKSDTDVSGKTKDCCHAVESIVTCDDTKGQALLKGDIKTTADSVVISQHITDGADQKTGVTDNVPCDPSEHKTEDKSTFVSASKVPNSANVIGDTLNDRQSDQLVARIECSHVCLSAAGDTNRDESSDSCQQVTSRSVITEAAVSKDQTAESGQCVIVPASKTSLDRNDVVTTTDISAVKTASASDVASELGSLGGKEKQECRSDSNQVDAEALNVSPTFSKADATFASSPATDFVQTTSIASPVRHVANESVELIKPSSDDTSLSITHAASPVMHSTEQGYQQNSPANSPSIATDSLLTSVQPISTLIVEKAAQVKSRQRIKVTKIVTPTSSDSSLSKKRQSVKRKRNAPCTSSSDAELSSAGQSESELSETLSEVSSDQHGAEEPPSKRKRDKALKTAGERDRRRKVKIIARQSRSHSHECCDATEGTSGDVKPVSLVSKGDIGESESITQKKSNSDKCLDSSVVANMSCEVQRESYSKEQDKEADDDNVSTNVLKNSFLTKSSAIATQQENIVSSASEKQIENSVDKALDVVDKKIIKCEDAEMVGSKDNSGCEALDVNVKSKTDSMVPALDKHKENEGEKATGLEDAKKKKASYVLKDSVNRNSNAESLVKDSVDRESHIVGSEDGPAAECDQSERNPVDSVPCQVNELLPSDKERTKKKRLHTARAKGIEFLEAGEPDYEPNNKMGRAQSARKSGEPTLEPVLEEEDEGEEKEAGKQVEAPEPKSKTATTRKRGGRGRPKAVAATTAKLLSTTTDSSSKSAEKVTTSCEDENTVVGTNKDDVATGETSEDVAVGKEKKKGRPRGTGKRSKKCCADSITGSIAKSAKPVASDQVQVQESDDDIPLIEVRRSLRANKGQRKFEVIVEGPKRKRKTNQQPEEEEKEEDQNKSRREQKENKRSKDESCDEQELSTKNKKKRKGKEPRDEDFVPSSRRKSSATGKVNGRTSKKNGRRGRKKLSDSEDNDEEEDEEEEEEDEELLFEPSPSEDSELDSDGSVYEPRGRNAKRAAAIKEKADKLAESFDDQPCCKCGKYTQPEWILLCDRCDAGYHTACIRPPLMMIPDGDWFCPPCEHSALISKLQEQLVDYDKSAKQNLRLIQRKQRLAFVGVNVSNILSSDQRSTKPPKLDSDIFDQELDDNTDSSDGTGGTETEDVEEEETPEERDENNDDDNDDGGRPHRQSERRTTKRRCSRGRTFCESSRGGRRVVSSSEEDEHEGVGSGKDEDDEEEGWLLSRRSHRQRKEISYKFEEFDELISTAIKDDILEEEDEGEEEIRQCNVASTALDGDTKSHDVGMASADNDAVGACEVKVKPKPPPARRVSKGKDMSSILGMPPEPEPSPVKRKKRGRKLTKLDSDDEDDKDGDDSEEYQLSEQDLSSMSAEEEDEDALDAEEESDDWNIASRAPTWANRSTRRRGARSRKRRSYYDDFVVGDDEYSDSEDDQGVGRPRRSAARRAVNYQEDTEEEEDSLGSDRDSTKPAPRKRAPTRRIICSDDTDSEPSAASRVNEPKRKQSRRKEADSDYDPCADEEAEIEQKRGVGRHTKGATGKHHKRVGSDSDAHGSVTPVSKKKGRLNNFVFDSTESESDNSCESRPPKAGPVQVEKNKISKSPQQTDTVVTSVAKGGSQRGAGKEGRTKVGIAASEVTSTKSVDVSDGSSKPNGTANVDQTLESIAKRVSLEQTPVDPLISLPLNINKNTAINYTTSPANIINKNIARAESVAKSAPAEGCFNSTSAASGPKSNTLTATSSTTLRTNGKAESQNLTSFSIASILTKPTINAAALSATSTSKRPQFDSPSCDDSASDLSTGINEDSLTDVEDLVNYITQG